MPYHRARWMSNVRWSPLLTPRRVWDVFMFDSELELLEARLQVLENVTVRAGVKRSRASALRLWQCVCVVQGPVVGTLVIVAVGDGGGDGGVGMWRVRGDGEG